MKLQKKNKEAGFVISSELIIVATILVIGLITGLASLRTQVQQELEDTGFAIGAINQSYYYEGLENDTGDLEDEWSAYSETAGSLWEDERERSRTREVEPQREGFDR